MMDTLLQNGDMRRDRRGLPTAISGVEEMIQRCMIRLTVRKGSFALDPGLGSELYRLSAVSPAGLDAAAENLVRQALLELPGVSVSEVRCVRTDDRLRLQITLTVNGETKKLEVNAG